MPASDTAQVASAAFAALAAGAAWAAVRQSRREWRRTQEPYLHLSATEIAGENARVELHIENSGGLARQVSFAVATNGEACVGHVGPTTMLAPGEGASILTGLTPGGRSEIYGVVICHDPSTRYVHAWSITGKHKRWRRRNWPTEQPKGGLWIFNQFHPEVDLDALPWMSSEVIRRERASV